MPSSVSSLISIFPVPGETEEILTNYLTSVIKNHNITKKIIGFCGDNCNTNFGCVKRRGENNIYSQVKKELGRNIVGIGCGAHIVHNSLQTAVDVLPIEIEALVVKIYKYFHIYMVRVTQLKEFCEFVDIEYKKILQHSNTHFLSLLPAIDRILEIYEGLKSYFISQEHCPMLIKQFFDNNCGEMYLWFMQGQLTLFKKSTLIMESTKENATDIVSELRKLKKNLEERRDNKFIPQVAKKLFRILENNGGININTILQEFTKFYDRCLSFIDLWGNSFGGTESFIWINNNELTWVEIEASGEKINETLANSAINLDELFDEVVIAKGFWSANYDIWKNTSCKEKWIQLFSHFKE